MTHDEIQKVRNALGVFEPFERKHTNLIEALDILDSELAAPEQEPVAWSHPDFDFAVMGKAPVNPPIEEWTPLVPLGSKSPAHQPAKPEPEPVAYWNKERMFCRADEVSDTPNWTDYYPYPLYTAPPPREWQGLTDEEIRQVYRSEIGSVTVSEAVMFIAVSRAIEAALRKKNSGEQA